MILSRVRTTGLYTISEACERYDVSRKTGYKWLARVEAEGSAGLADRSRAPHGREHRMAEAVRGTLLEVRRRHPRWGPRKILAWLGARDSRTTWPAASSGGELLRREGLVSARRRRPQREPHPGPPQIAAKEPNDLWTTDFKGPFPTKNPSTPTTSGSFRSTARGRSTSTASSSTSAARSQTSASEWRKLTTGSKNIYFCKERLARLFEAVPAFAARRGIRRRVLGGLERTG